MKRLLSMFVALGLFSFVGCGEEAPKPKPSIKPMTPPKPVEGKKEEAKKDEKKAEEKKAEPKKEEKKVEEKKDEPKKEEKK